MKKLLSLCFKNMNTLSFLLISSILYSCGNKDVLNKNQEARNSAIIGGAPVISSEWNNVVALVKDNIPFCTGTLIHPKVVLTAAHCVDIDLPASMTFTDSVKVYVGPGRDSKQLNAQYNIVRARINPKYQKYALGNADTAYLVLERPITSIQILPILTNPMEIKSSIRKGNNATILGFGKRGNDYLSPSGRKYIVETKIFDSSSNEVRMGLVGKAACFGDSGGPAFTKVNGEWKQFGVLSRGSRYCGEDDSSDIYGLAHDSICWIQEETGQILNEDANCQKVKVSYSDTEIESLDFESICEDEYASLHQKNTIEAIKDGLYSGRRGNCKKNKDELENKHTIDLDNYLITDVSPLSNLSNVRKISLKDNRIRSIRPLINLKTLKRLNVAWNDIPQEEFEELEREIPGLKIIGKRLQHYNYKDTYFLKTCLNRRASNEQRIEAGKIIKGIYAQGESCESANLDLVTRQYLSLEGMDIKDISLLSGLENISYLNLSANEIKEIPLSVIESLSSLEMLILDWNPIAEKNDFIQLIKKRLPELRLESKLEQPNFKNTLAFRVCNDAGYSEEEERIYDKIGNSLFYVKLNLPKSCKMTASNMLEMDTLELDDLQLESIGFLKDFKNIQKLNLANNNISDLTPLEDLPNIFNLNLKNNKITTIKSLLKLESLFFLDISGNLVEDISLLGEIDFLQQLILSEGSLFNEDNCPLKFGECVFQ